MIFVKFIVMFGCISILSASQTNYCEICSNHTLCQYKISGPSTTCKFYETAALLSSQDMEEIVHKINERRNFIATGGSALFPQASNMKKIIWSPTLADFAQRWADQCDQFLHPDREDDCRDLENIKVGQNIGSVIGTSPGLSVKNFIEMWFMQILDYSGSVAYYNQSQNHHRNYFTQLIWAETELVGCGKAKFYVDEKQMMLERLVCNFAPKGNVKGKPIYAIGKAGTQCLENMVTDREFRGLCTYEDLETPKQSTIQRPPVSNLLKTLNLSNDTYEQEEVYLKHNDLKAINYKKHKQKNIKTRHILSSNSEDTVRRTMIRDQHRRKSFMQNMSRNMKDNEYIYQHEQGHSHLYHGNEPATHELYLRPMYPPKFYFQGNNNQDLKRYDYTTAPVYLISSPIYRQYNMCSRKRIQKQFCCYSHQCTRRPGQCCHRSTGCQSETFTNPTLPETIGSQNRRCCSTCPPTCPPLLTTVDNCNHNCNCAHSKCTKDAFRSIYFQNLLRSGVNHKINYSTKDNLEQYYDSKLSKTHKTIHENKDTDQTNEDEIVKEETMYTKYKDHDFFHRAETEFRKKRELEDEITIKPFWKINEKRFKTKETKALRYTTLSNRNILRNHRLSSTETITITAADYSNEENYEDNNDKELTTEKYLSFDELMHLGKLNMDVMDYNARRQGDKNKDSSKKKNKTDKDKKGKDKKDKDKKGKDKKDKDKKGKDKKDKDKKDKSKKDKDKKDKDKKDKDKKDKDKKDKDKKHKDKKDKDQKDKDQKTKDQKATGQKATDQKDKNQGKNNDNQAIKLQQVVEHGKNDTKETPVKPMPVANTTKEYTTKEYTTKEYTANTPFVRIKQCTRKLTCTWTLFTGTAENGKQIRPELDVGSRTPPGYVEGCTRTSTCTRDFQDRNKKLSTLPENSEHETDEAARDGYDYCEKRNLEVKRDNFDYKDATTTSNNHKVYKKQFNFATTVEPSKTHNCRCNKKLRQKRQESASSINDSKIMSYADLYYLVLNKIIKTNQAPSHDANRCLCNCTTYHANFLFCVFCFIFNIIL